MTMVYIFNESHPLAAEVELLPALLTSEAHNVKQKDPATMDWKEFTREEAKQALSDGLPVIFSDDCCTYLKVA